MATYDWMTHCVPLTFKNGPNFRPSLMKSVAEAPARLRDFSLCWMFLSLASTGFLEQLKMPTDGALSTICLPSPCH